MKLTLHAPAVTASSESRTITGTIVNYGVPGRTSAGLLSTRAGALTFPTDLTRAKLTIEHYRSEVVGYLASLDDNDTSAVGSFKIANTPAGDTALLEAAEKVRDGLSFDLVDVVLEGDEIVSATVIAIGLVTFPAYDDSRVASVAASRTPAAPTHPGENMPLTAEEIARLAALRVQASRTAEEETELVALAARETAPVTASTPTPAQVTAALIPAVPAGLPAPTPGLQVSPRGDALDQFVHTIVAGYADNNPASITAALVDVTSTDHTDIIEAPAWSGELWSGVQYESEFTPLLNSGPLTSWKGEGWRWKIKPEIEDYTGDKGAIPSKDIETEPSEWEAARMAVGHDIDRKFYDFPNEAFLRGYVEAVRESWAMKLDIKTRTWISTNAVPVLNGATPRVEPTLLKAAARAVLAVKRRRAGRASFVAVNDEDMFTLMDVTKNDVPAWLELYNIDPKNFVSSPDIAAGTVLAGVKQTATVKTLPGSPIRATAQNIANGGIDEGFFGYWAIEEHHTSGIASVQYTAPVEPEVP